MSSYCIMRVGKVKAAAGFTRKMEHNFRLEKVPNADPDKQHLNEELIKMKDDTYYDAFKRRLAECHHIPRKNAVMGLEVMLTYNKKDLGPEFDMDAWKKVNVDWLTETFGKENVVSAILHLDEGTPHIHAMVIPMVDGRLCASRLIDGRDKLSALQSEYAEKVSSLGLERGMKHSTATHEDIKRFYAALKKELGKELPSVNKGETAAEYRERANEFFKDSNCQHLQELLEERRKTVEAKTGNLGEKIEFWKDKENVEERELNLENREKEIAVWQKKAARLDEVLNGLKNGALPPDQKVIFENAMMAVAKWERERVASVAAEKDTVVMPESNTKEIPLGEN